MPVLCPDAARLASVLGRGRGHNPSRPPGSWNTDRMDVQWWSVFPFAAILLTIAVAPLIPRVSHYWEHPRVQLLVSLVLGLPVALWFLIGGDRATVAHTLVEYAQFICLLLALFVVSGGIYVKGDILATPRNNTAFLAVGALSASFVGTTGAAMLLIRPILNTNAQRVHRMHTVVFTIFIVANSGGLLTPLGDPPLFLGMLRGVPFLWTMHLFPEWLFVNILLLLTYYALDRRFYAWESAGAVGRDKAQREPLGLSGAVHFGYLAIVIAAVAFLPSTDLAAIEHGSAGLVEWVPWREVAMVVAVVLSIRTGDPKVRYEDNSYRWRPILEVAAIFIGIFLTMMPALKYLAKIAPTLPLNEVTFFLFTGGLSSVLDNAPTYLTFFEMAQQLPGHPRVADVPEHYLVAISLGAVFCGAMTYIGNGPNFMVKAVADGWGVRMPSFGGYIVLALKELAPVLAAMVLIFIADPWWAHVLGLALTGVLLLRVALYVRRSLRPVP